MTDLHKHSHTFEFKVPAPGVGKPKDLRAAGEIVGRRFAEIMFGQLQIAEQCGVLTENLSAALLKVAIGDMRENAQELRDRNFAEREIAHFERGMRHGFKTFRPTAVH